MSEPLVHIRDFRMAFGATTVIEDLSFDFHAGETFGFLGSNGSGKTTTLRALLGIYQPTAGTLRINGKVFEPADGARLGYLPEERGLYKKEPVLETMVYFGRLKGLDKQKAKAWSLEYLERVGLAEKAVNRRLLMDIIEDQQRAGATVVMVTHQMEEVERLCDRVILLKDGTSHAYGTVRAVQEQFGGTTYRVTHTGVVPPSHHYTVVATEPAGEGQVSHLAPNGGADETTVLAELVGAGVAVSGFSTARTSLEEIFIRVYGADSLNADTDAAQTVGVGV